MFILWPLGCISGISFAIYGYRTLFGSVPRGEFERYGMPATRQFVGTTQFLGAAGVFAGFAYAPFGVIAAGGLTLMMVLGLIVRSRIGDTLVQMAPAATFGIINAALVYLFLLS